MKKFFTLFVAALIATMAWGAETTFNCATLFASSAEKATQGTYTFTTAGGSTAATLNTTSNDLRIYAGGTFKIETTGENFTKVVFVLSTKGKQRLSEITASAGTITTQALGDETVTWTGNAKSVTFTCGASATYGSDGANKAGQFDFTEFTITDGGSGGGVIPGTDPDPSGALKTLNEDFEGNAIPTTWKQAQVSGDKVWYTATYQNNTYAAMTGYKGTTPPFDQWLITPALDIENATNKTLNFRTEVNGYGSTTTVLEVYVMSTDDPATATKTKLNPALPTAPESGYSDWKESGDIDLSAYNGTYYIGFRYYATQDANYATWCVDDVKFNVGGSVTPDPGTYTDATIADLVKLTEAKKNVNLKLTNAVVLFADADNNNKQVFVRDELEGEHAIQFYNLGIALKDYDVLNGEIKVDYDYYKEFPEVKAISGVTNADGLEISELGEEEEIHAWDVTIADLNEGLYKNDVVYLAEVELTLDGKNYYVVDEDGNKVQLYDKFGYELLPEEVEEGTIVSAMGIFGQYFNGIPEVYLLDLEGAGAEGDYLSDILYYSEDGAEVTVADDLYVAFADDNSRVLFVTDNYYDEWDLSDYGMGTYVFYPSWVALDFSDNEDGYAAVKDAMAIKGGTITGIIDGVALNPSIAVETIPEEVDVEEPELILFEYDFAEPIEAYSNEVGYAKCYYKNGKLYGTADGTDAPVDFDMCYIDEFTFSEGQQYELLALFTIKEEWEAAADESGDDAPARVRLNGEKKGVKAARNLKARKALADRRHVRVDDPNANSNYTIFILDRPEVGVNDVNASKQVKSVNYYNMLGVQGAEPFQGVNVVEITYTDGTRKAVKVVK